MSINHHSVSEQLKEFGVDVPTDVVGRSYTVRTLSPTQLNAVDIYESGPNPIGVRLHLAKEAMEQVALCATGATLVSVTLRDQASKPISKSEFEGRIDRRRDILSTSPVWVRRGDSDRWDDRLTLPSGRGANPHVVTLPYVGLDANLSYPHLFAAITTDVALTVPMDRVPHIKLVEIQVDLAPSGDPKDRAGR